MQFVADAQLVEEAGGVGFLGVYTVNLLSGELRAMRLPIAMK